MADGVAVCLVEGCGWKIVSPDPSQALAGHRAATKHNIFKVEDHEAGHPTMLHEDAERIGQCWHADAIAENAEHDAPEVRAMP